jgi:hypothetical protein
MQNYLQIESNVVTNVVVWDGNPETWTPPTDAIMLVQSTTPALIWLAVVPATKPITYTLQEVVGQGSVGFTWDGLILTTNQPDLNPA